MDEAGFNLTKRRRRGRNIIGHRATVDVPGQRGGNITMGAAISENGVLTHIPIIGPYNTECLVTFLDTLYRDIIPEQERGQIGDDLPNSESMVDGRKITVIDTPGIFDTHDDDDMKIKHENVRCMIESAPAVDALVIVLKVGRYTKQETETVDKTLADKCGGCCHVISSREYKSNGVQVKNLLDKIEEMVKVNGHYTTEMLQKLEERNQVDIDKNITPRAICLYKRKEKKGIVHEEYVKRLAGLAEGTLIDVGERDSRGNEIIHEKILKQLVGAATGVVIGALLGASKPSHDIIGAIAGMAIGASLAFTVLVLNNLVIFIYRGQHQQQTRIMGANISRKIVGALTGTVTGAGLVMLGLLTQVFVIARRMGIAQVLGAAGFTGITRVTGVTAPANEVAEAAANRAAAVAQKLLTAISTGLIIAALGGCIIGYEEGGQADSMYDATTRALDCNFELAKYVIKKVREFIAFVLKDNRM
ncbi:uncharacterized protein LOC107707284 [Sinocyclocheilus rhinocerous]|uniref:uncharacterized protein LOC107707284 n=1 Tax=Sinocyclocheilus rhinocerous TaxID=307959 RepID=UPI0007B95CEE|nr:PREDICTED: uncharacterized protein LOC107707284 [Sinocyclocheilus rhinocerous]